MALVACAFLGLHSREKKVEPQTSPVRHVNGQACKALPVIGLEAEKPCVRMHAAQSWCLSCPPCAQYGAGRCGIQSCPVLCRMVL